MTDLKQTIRYTKAPDGRAIAWSTMGSGPSVVVFSCHGHLEAELRSSVHARLYGDLARRFTVVRYDGRGSGLSDRSHQDVTLAGQLEDVTAVIDAARLDRFSVFALANGSNTAIEFAAGHPDRIDKLVIYGGPVRGLLHRQPTTEQLARREAMLNALEAGWDDQAFRTLNYRQATHAATQEEIEDAALLMHTRSSAAAFIGYIRWQMATDVAASARRVQAPTLVLHSREDPRVPFSEGQLLASLIPHAEFAPVESRGMVVLPSELAYADAMKRILDFLATDKTNPASPPTLPHLTPREHQVLELIAQGKDNLQIAAHLSMSEKTVRNHVTPIFDKLQVENRAQAIVRVREAGMGKG